MQHIHVDELYPIPHSTPSKGLYPNRQSTEDPLGAVLSDEDVEHLRSMDEQMIETLTRIQRAHDK